MSTLLTATLAALVTSQSLAPLADRVLAHPDLPQRAAGHRLASIRASTAVLSGSKGTPRTVVSVVLFDHTALEARRVTMDPATNRLLSNEPLRGRPQRSAGEYAEAVAIVRRTPALAGLLDAGAVLDGGFVVDDPGGSRRRMIQLKLSTATRRSLLRTIVVDLTRGELASVTTGHGGR